MRKFHLYPILKVALAATLLTACSPTYNWRDFRSADAPYSVLFPAKPDTQTRHIDLDGQGVDMTMAAAEVDGVTFAVGSAQLADAAKAQAGIAAMKRALVNNIGAKVVSDKAGASSSAGTGQQGVLEVEAKGEQRGEAMLLVGRFIARKDRIYQVIVVGREKQVVRDTVDTFMSSFKPD